MATHSNKPKGNRLPLCISHRTIGLWSDFLGIPQAVLVARLRMLSPSAHVRLKSGYSDADLFDLEGDGLGVDVVLGMPRSVWKLRGVKLKGRSEGMGEAVKAVMEAHEGLESISFEENKDHVEVKFIVTNLHHTFFSLLSDHAHSGNLFRFR